MIVVLNDISWRCQCKDKYAAIDSIKRGVDILMALRKLDSSFKLYSKEKITGLEIAPGYYFNQLFSEKNDVLPRVYITAIKTFFTNFNKIKENHGTFSIGSIKSEQCGYAYVNENIVHSIITDDIFEMPQLSGVYESPEGIIKEGKVMNLSQEKHLNENYHALGSRIYESNPKHKVNYGWGSVMDLEDRQAQELLNQAIKVDENGKHLAAKYNGMYYSFRCHLNNCYHGYQDNSLPENIKSQLDGE